jgi:hypothetical protein
LSSVIFKIHVIRTEVSWHVTFVFKSDRNIELFDDPADDEYFLGEDEVRGNWALTYENKGLQRHEPRRYWYFNDLLNGCTLQTWII